MAVISAIKLPSGNTYDLKDNISGYTTNTGTITKVQTTAGAHSTINVSSGAATFNVPTKTSHLTNDSGFITNSTLYEANLQWGGKNFSASYGPIDAAMIDSLGANRLELVNANGIIVEYSRDNGVTWNDYELADNDKRKIISSIGGSAFLGKYTSADFGNVTTDWKLRITLVFPAAGTYTVLNKFAIYMSSQGANGPYVTIDGCKKSDESVFTVFAENVSINGWSGWNIINTSGITTYANTTSQYSKIRFTFGITSVSSWAGDLDHPTYHSAINISKILGFGGVGWSVPTQLAKDGHLYSYDVNQNAIFPAKVTASGGFSGNLTGNVTGNVSGSAGSVAWSGVTSKPTTISGYGITDAKIASGVITLGSDTITPLTSSSTLNAAKLSGAIPSAVTATTQASTDNSTKIATTAYVTTAIANLPEPMLFKGSVGTGGTVTSLPTAAASNEGWTYKVITALSSPSAKVGDTVISNGSEWVVIPSGDEPSGTVTSVGITNGGGLSVSGSPITSSGSITVSHADTSSQASSSNSGRTYIQSITLDTYGHVTALSTATETVTNTDTKVSTAAVTSGTTYYPVVGADTTSAATKFYDKTGLVYKGTNGTTSTVGGAELTLGNSTASGTANNKQAQLVMYGSNAKKATITLAAPSADIALALPTSAGTLALTSQIPTVPNSTGSSTTSITASTTATKTTLGTAFTIPNVTSAGSASSWTFEEKTIPNVTAAGSASTWAFEDIACDDITNWSAGSGSSSLTMAMDTTDTKKLKITFSHTHTAPSLSYTARTVSSKKSGSNGTAPTLGTAIKVQSKSGGGNGTAPTLGTAFTVPNVTGNTSATVSITDNGHTHTI